MKKLLLIFKVTKGIETLRKLSNALPKEVLVDNLEVFYKNPVGL